MLLLNKNFRMCLCLLCIGVVLSSLSGCASRGAYFSTITAPQNDKAVLYVYRKFAFMGAGQSVQVEDNNIKLIPKLSVNTYQSYYIEPGRHVVATNSDCYTCIDGDATFKAEANKTYFVRFELDMYKSLPTSVFALVPEELALDELKGYRLAL